MKFSTQQSGFTLIETLVAILILTLTMGALFSLASGGIFSARYARNQIIANTLQQEALESLRNSRDSAQLQGTTWTNWTQSFRTGTTKCFDADGCTIDPYATDSVDADNGLKVTRCTSTCPKLVYYPNSSFYGYTNVYPSINGSGAYETSFSRKVKMEFASGNPDQVLVTVTMTWLNGTASKSVNQSMLLTNWQL